MNNTKENELLTPHFSKWEMKRSETTLRHNLINEPDTEQWRSLYILCSSVLEPLRLRFGAIIITSGFRSKELNERIGGVINSQHCCGEAADIYIGSSEKAVKYFNFIQENTDFDQLISEPSGRRLANASWLHVSFTTRHPNRHQNIIKQIIPNKNPRR